MTPPPATTTTPTRSVLMTGASRGLGLQAALSILRDHPDWHLIVTQRGTRGELAAALTAQSGNPNVSEIFCDLTSLASVADAADQVHALTAHGPIPPLAAILANAGIQFTHADTTTTDGYETTFAVNVLANAVLINKLAPHLIRPGRILITTSDTHFGDFNHNMGMVPAPRWRNPTELATPGSDTSKTAGGIAYSTSKLAVIYLVHALSQTLPAGIDIYSYNPGLVPGTGLARDRNLANRIGWRAIMPIMRLTPKAASPKHAGRLLAQAAVGARPGDTGTYIDRGTIIDSSAESYNPTREQQLLTHTRTLSTPAG